MSPDIDLRKRCLCYSTKWHNKGRTKGDKDALEFIWYLPAKEIV